MYVNFVDGVQVCEMIFFAQFCLDHVNFDFVLCKVRANSEKTFTFLDDTVAKLVGVLGDDYHLVPVSAVLHKVFLIKYNKIMHPTDSLLAYDEAVYKDLHIVYELDTKFEFEH